MAQEVAGRDVGFEIVPVPGEQFVQIFPEVFHEQVAAFAMQDPVQVVPVRFQVIQEMGQLQIDAPASRGIIVIRFLGEVLVEDVVKNSLDRKSVV